MWRDASWDIFQPCDFHGGAVPSVALGASGSGFDARWQLQGVPTQAVPDQSPKKKLRGLEETVSCWPKTGNRWICPLLWLPWPAKLQGFLDWSCEDNDPRSVAQCWAMHDVREVSAWHLAEQELLSWIPGVPSDHLDDSRDRHRWLVASTEPRAISGLPEKRGLLLFPSPFPPHWTIEVPEVLVSPTMEGQQCAEIHGRVESPRPLQPRAELECPVNQSRLTLRQFAVVKDNHHRHRRPPAQVSWWFAGIVLVFVHTMLCGSCFFKPMCWCDLVRIVNCELPWGKNASSCSCILMLFLIQSMYKLWKVIHGFHLSFSGLHHCCCLPETTSCHNSAL